MVVGGIAVVFMGTSPGTAVVLWGPFYDGGLAVTLR
jgi:hypothetical protein